MLTRSGQTTMSTTAKTDEPDMVQTADGTKRPRITERQRTHVDSTMRRALWSPPTAFCSMESSREGTERIFCVLL
jgi:hypothetical protein